MPNCSGRSRPEGFRRNHQWSQRSWTASGSLTIGSAYAAPPDSLPSRPVACWAATILFKDIFAPKVNVLDVFICFRPAYSRCCAPRPPTTARCVSRRSWASPRWSSWMGTSRATVRRVVLGHVIRLSSWLRGWRIHETTDQSLASVQPLTWEHVRGEACRDGRCQYAARCRHDPSCRRLSRLRPATVQASEPRHRRPSWRTHVVPTGLPLGRPSERPLIGSGRSSSDSDEYPHSGYPVRQRPGRRPGDQATRYNESLLYVYDAGMAADRDQLAVCAVPGRKAEVIASASSACLCEAVAVTRGCCHAAVGVSLTGSRTVLSPKSATRSSRPPRAST